jgi:hypothetical protein
VEVNWTLPILIPLLIFFLRYSVTNPVFTRWFYILAVPVFVLVSILRLEIVHPVFNLKISRIENFRRQKEFVTEIHEKCEGLPIVTNSYQKAGIVSFYTNTFAPSINLNTRRNQFNLWHANDSLRFKKVAFVNNYLDEGVQIQNSIHKDYKITFIDSLPVMNDIQITPGIKNISVKPNRKVEINVVLLSAKAPENYRDAGGYTTRLYASLYKEKSLLNEEVSMMSVNHIFEKNNGKYNFEFEAPTEKGKYQIVISLKTSKLGTWNTKKTVKLTVD